MTIHDALTARARELGHSPAVVFRHADTGERTELSWATLHNWASKGANLLLDHFDAGLGALAVLRSIGRHNLEPVMSCLLVLPVPLPPPAVTVVQRLARDEQLLEEQRLALTLTLTLTLTPTPT